VCGDGFIFSASSFPPGPEECDDGNLTTGDGCDASCLLEECSVLIPDQDGDGEADPTDLCPDTTGSPVDANGCDLDQFCNAISPNVPTLSKGIKKCVLADFQNTGSRDCRKVKISRRPLVFGCIPK
jgi:cysteine-rich repeat protein